MQSIINALRQIVGTPDFYKQLSNGSSGYSNYTWDYAAMFEYFFACLLVCIVVSWVFRLLKDVFA